MTDLSSAPLDLSSSPLDLSPPPPQFDFDVVGYHIRERTRISSFMQDKLNLALAYAKKFNHLEHHTVRYVMILLQIIFYREKFNIVPQFYSWVGCYPDIALETYYDRPESSRKRGFVCADFFEAKPGNSHDDPIAQLTNAIGMEYGYRFHSRGLLVGVVGFTWRFVEYQWVSVSEEKNPVLIKIDFHTYHENLPTDSSRPQPSREYKDGDYMDLSKKEEAKDILNILIWRSNDGKTRNLYKTRDHAEPFKASLTRSTMGMPDSAYEIPEIEEGDFILSVREFGHIAPFLTAQDSQEGDRMEVD